MTRPAASPLDEEINLYTTVSNNKRVYTFCFDGEAADRVISSLTANET